MRLYALNATQCLVGEIFRFTTVDLKASEQALVQITIAIESKNNPFVSDLHLYHIQHSKFYPRTPTKGQFSTV